MPEVVYRIECDQGHGPYNGPARKRLEALVGYPDGVLFGAFAPAPWEDGLGWYWKNAMPRGVFGFASLDQLRQWFNAYALDKLHEAGCYLATYEAEELLHGRSQVVFDPLSARRTSLTPLTSLPVN